jgi:hypothetical protein
MAFTILPYYHYLLVSYFLTVWIQKPLVVAFLYLTFQAIWGSAVEPTPVSDFIGWYTLVAVLGIICGRCFLWITKPPKLLKWGDRHAEVWIKMLISVGVFVGSTVPYAVWQPPTHAWGLILSTALVGMVVVFTALMLYWIKHLFKDYEDVYFFFVYWAATTTIMSASFFLVFAMHERWAALCAGGITLIVILVATIMCPYYTEVYVEDDRVERKK